MSKPDPTELAACPFCGSDAAQITHDHGTYEPGCTHCGTYIGQYSSERSARVAWNRRAVPALVQPEPSETNPMQALARRCLWIAYCWNDHNFKSAHLYARREAEAHGIRSFEDANRWLAAAPVPSPEPREPTARLAESQIRSLMQVAHKWAGPDESDSRSDELEMALRAVRVPAAPPSPPETVTDAQPTRWHELKTDPDVFDAVADGRKPFEIRLNDRDFRVGDGLRLRRTRDTGWAMKNTGAPLVYTGEACERVVTYVLHGPQYGLADGWVIMSLAHIGKRPAMSEDAKDAARYRWLRALSPGKGNRWPHISIYPWHAGIDGPMQRLPVFDLAGYHPDRLDEWIDAALSTAPTKERPINQCDGCRQGAPLRNGLHIDSNGRAFMACERDKYERRAAQPTGKMTDADGVQEDRK